MTKLARKLVIGAGEKGLILRQIGTKHEIYDDVQVTYGSYQISSLPQERSEKDGASSLESQGVVGILDLKSIAYLIVIIKQKQVAQVRGKAIYVIRDVKMIPLDSQAEAEKSIKNAENRLKGSKNTAEESETEESDADEDQEPISLRDNERADDAPAIVPAEDTPRQSGAATKEATQGKGRSGTFAQRWLRKKSLKPNARKKQELSTEDNQTTEKQPIANGSAVAQQSGDQEGEDVGAQCTGKTETSNEASRKRSAIETLAPRIKRNARLFFSWSGFYYSYEHDLSGTLLQKGSTVSDIPLWKRFDPIYFWNRNLTRPFIDAGCDQFVLPLMQGFVGQRAFSVAKTDDEEATDRVVGASSDAAEVVDPSLTTSDTQDSEGNPETQELLLTLVSRRSVVRAGLRYLRRGVDDNGNVANSVETEQILSTRSWDVADKAFSLLQLRGSIPLHFTQTPGRLKPAPVLFGSEANNQAALRKHFTLMIQRYRQVQAVSLTDVSGVEAPVGEAYDKHMKRLNDDGRIDGKKIGFEWFDFHNVCKGMRFENVSVLMETLDSTLKSFGWNVKQDDRNVGQQAGVVRSNCMDCLDRTNIVQSYIGRWALEQQLSQLGFTVDLSSDPKTQWFNTLWADNGDAISMAYAGSAAMKSDFTRTRKRNWTGALSDLSLTLTRYYNNMFGDYFMQTCRDYYLGNATSAIFDDFETDMMSKDYALDTRRIRSNAIETCEKIVLEAPSEKLLAGWTLSCPRKTNTLRTLPFEECVVLLTNVAFYFCRFDWNTEKAGSFEKVDLRDILAIWRGAYITSGLGATNLDETKNVGFAMKYSLTENSIIRQGTGRLEDGGESSKEDEGDAEEQKGNKSEEDPKKDAESEAKDKTKETEERLLAFKALPPQLTAAKYESDKVASTSEVELIRHICDVIHKARVQATGGRDCKAVPDEGESAFEVKEEDVISVAKARKNTGYVESIGYSLKRLVWS